jgi:hypothetical protein
MKLIKQIQASLYFCLLTFFPSIEAKELVVATIVNDDNPNVVKFILDIDETTHSVNNFYKETYLKSVLILREKLEAKNLEGDGIKLEERDNRVILALKSDSFNQNYGGELIIDSLYNGTIDERKNYYLELTREQDGWYLLSEKKKITQLFIETNKIPILGVIGIKNILMK